MFRLHSIALLAVIVVIGVTAALWILNSKQLDSNNWFPVFFPPLELLKLSVVCAPVLGTTSMIAACVLWLRCRPLPYLPVLFLCCAPIVFVAPLAAAMRIIAILILITLLLFAEISVRQLPSVAVYASSCCLFVIFCYYMFATSLFAGAYV